MLPFSPKLEKHLRKLPFLICVCFCTYWETYFTKIY